MAHNLNRRKLLRAAGLSAAGLVASKLTRAAQNTSDKAPNLPTPLPRQVTWQDFELGLLYHFDLDVYMPGGHHHERSRREKLDPNLFNPARLDTDRWLEAARAMGARYAIFTATHHQGFLQWQSDAYPFGLRQIAWRNGKADIVKDFVESCRKYNIAPGLYVGIRFNAYWQVYNYNTNAGKGDDDNKQRHYMRICERMVEELCSRYGPLCEIWFDGGVITPEQGGPDVLPIIEKYQPKAIFYHSLQRAEHRWAGSETGTTGYPCYSTMPTVASQIRAHADRKKRTTLLKQPTTFNHVVIMEDIASGERVRGYIVEALVENGQWRKICDGESIGHKCIQLLADKDVVEAKKVRFRATQTVAMPVIRNLALYNF